jgi:hypothetical protein
MTDTWQSRRAASCDRAVVIVWFAVLFGSFAAVSPAHAQAHLEARQAAAERKRADALAAAGHHAAAVGAYKNAIRLGAYDAEIQAHMGRSLLALGRAQEAVEALAEAVDRDPERLEYYMALGDACHADGDDACAARSYLYVLQSKPDPAAARAYEALHRDAFAHAYEFAPDRYEPDPPPFETSGPTFSFGIGAQYAQLGAHVAYDYRFMGTPFLLAPYLGGGCMPASTFQCGAVAGVMGKYGGENRWMLSAGYGLLGAAGVTLYGVPSVTSVNGFSFTAGREWLLDTSLFVRLLGGIAVRTDALASGTNRLEPEISIGLVVKPW